MAMYLWARGCLSASDRSRHRANKLAAHPWPLALGSEALVTEALVTEAREKYPHYNL
jgi:hypothetical protein